MYIIPNRKDLIFLDDDDNIPLGFVEVKARADVDGEPERWERAVMRTGLADAIVSDGHWKQIDNLQTPDM